MDLGNHGSVGLNVWWWFHGFAEEGLRGVLELRAEDLVPAVQWAHGVEGAEALCLAASALDWATAATLAELAERARSGERRRLNAATKAELVALGLARGERCDGWWWTKRELVDVLLAVSHPVADQHVRVAGAAPYRPSLAAEGWS